MCFFVGDTFAYQVSSAVCWVFAASPRNVLFLNVMMHSSPRQLVCAEGHNKLALALLSTTMPWTGITGLLEYNDTN